MKRKEFSNKGDQENLEVIASKQVIDSLLKESRILKWLIMFFGIGLVLVSLIAAIGYFRRPKVLVAVQTADGQRIAQIDDVKFGEKEKVSLGADRLTDEDKRYLVNTYLKNFYAVNLPSRAKDIANALQTMLPKLASREYKRLGNEGVLQTERDQSWSASWETESFELASSNKNKVQVIGTQKIEKLIDGKVKTETLQFKILFQLVTNGKRDGTPFRTGFHIGNLKAELIKKS